MKSKINPEEWKFDENAKSISYFSIKKPVCVNRELIEELKRISEENGNVNARFCLHNNPDETLHDMIILEYLNKKCKKPHKHLDKDETLQIIEGEMLVLMFDKEGNLTHRKILNRDNFAYRTSRGEYHVWLPTTKYVIYREIKQGPFKPGDNIPPKFDHVKVLKENVGSLNLDCYNERCNNPCSRSKLSKTEQII